jgi:cyanophycin synthetase
MGTLLNIRSLRFFYGCKYEVAGKTALLDLEIEGEIPDQVLDYLETWQGFTALNPAEALYGVPHADWVGHFLSKGRGTFRLADIIAAMLVALQLWGRSPVCKSQVIKSFPGRIFLALPWQRQALLKEAVHLAIAFVSTSETEPDAISADLHARVSNFLTRMQPGGVAPNTMRFARAAMERGMPVTVLNQKSIRVGHGTYARSFRSSFSDQTPSLAERVVRNKWDCNQRLKQVQIPVPKALIAYSLPQAEAAAASLGWPVVVKPATLDQGVGVQVGVSSSKVLVRAFGVASKLQDRGVLVEEFIPGEDHRILVVNGRMMMACRRSPGGVIGDGVATVTALLDRLNDTPQRGTDARSSLIKITLDTEALSCLEEAGLTPDSIPEEGCVVPLRRTANISTGGTSVDVTEQVHPDNRMVAIRAARIVGLDIAGVDFICRDISISYREGGGAICEVNAQPGFRPHWLSAPERDINGEILDILFEGHRGRIPTAAISGTNGKSTTARMLHHIWQTSGKVAGVCTSVGTWIGEERVDTQNLSGVPGAALIFADPVAEAAVLEMPRLGLIRFGHACEHYDVAALLNVQKDHIGQNGINTLEDMARVKSEVTNRAHEAIVVNAEDPLCLEFTKNAPARRHILIAMRPDAPGLTAHLAKGGDGAYIDSNEGEDWVIFARGDQRQAFMKTAEIPATMGGHVRFNIFNAMCAAVLADAQGVKASVIRKALASFSASRENNPGRYNMVENLPFQLMVDYAHNEVGVTELCRIVESMPVTGKRLLVLSIIGSSGPAKFYAIGRRLVDLFDQIAVTADPKYIRKYGYYTGSDPLGEMLQTTRDVFVELGARPEQILTGRDGDALARTTFETARSGDLVLLLEGADTAYRQIDQFRAEMHQSNQL